MTYIFPFQSRSSGGQRGKKLFVFEMDCGIQKSPMFSCIIFYFSNLTEVKQRKIASLNRYFVQGNMYSPGLLELSPV